MARICYASGVPNQSKAAAPPSPAAPPFEEALQKLEAVVETMEADDLPGKTGRGRVENPATGENRRRRNQVETAG
jgi:hypothetical protein